MKKILAYLMGIEVVNYLIVGTLATIVDWTIFALTSYFLKWPYQIALVAAFTGGGSLHYVANKVLTFRCTSKRYASQLTLYVIVEIIALSLSLLVMSVLVYCLPLNKIILRMLTTLIMVLPNYFMHKYVTFSKRIFL